MPLLGAPWYAEELQRRDRLVPNATFGDVLTLSRQIADAARRAGRPVAVAATVPAADRNRLGLHWKAIGFAYLSQRDDVAGQRLSAQPIPAVSIDSTATARAAARVGLWMRDRSVHPSLDPVHEYFLSVLGCPRLMLQPPSAAQRVSLDSLCNLR